jgi:hypothetical protein
MLLIMARHVRINFFSPNLLYLLILGREGYCIWSHGEARTLYDSSGREIGSSQRPLPDNTQQSQEREVHVLGRIRARSLSNRTAVDNHLRPLCHRDQP